jgi:hypothetical protein
MLPGMLSGSVIPAIARPAAAHEVELLRDSQLHRAGIQVVLPSGASARLRSSNIQMSYAGGPSSGRGMTSRTWPAS